MTADLLEARGVAKRYGATTVLTGVDLRVGPGEVRALMGENGAGKSTLLKVLSGELKPDAGEVLVAGHRLDVRRPSVVAARRRGIAIVHQEFSLVPTMTVAENIFLGREPRSGPLLGRRALRDRSEDLLRQVRCSVDPGTRVGELGIADAQLVEIAKALAGDVRVLALDEPSAILSGAELEALFTIIHELRDAGVGIIYVSHRINEVFALADTYTVLKDGAVSGQGRIAETDGDSLVSLMVGRAVSQLFPEPGASPGASALRIRGYRVPGLAGDVDLDVHAGEILGLAGLQGSGRTRLAKAIFGEIPAHGTLELDGIERRPFRSPAEAIRSGVAYIPEDRKSAGLALARSVSSNMSMMVLRRLRGRTGLLSRTQERALVGAAIRTLSIRTALTGADVVGTLSGGNQQKVVLAKWLELGPRVVLFDEPTRGIDVGAKEQIYQLVRDLADQGVAIVLISSELLEVLGLSDRLLVMADGRVVGELPGRSSTEEDVMRLVTGAPAASPRGRS